MNRPISLHASFKTTALGIALALGLSACSQPAEEATQAAAEAFEPKPQAWLAEFSPSTLTEAEQLAEMAWFTQAAEPLRGLSINVVSETLTTHEYE